MTFLMMDCDRKQMSW